MVAAGWVAARWLPGGWLAAGWLAPPVRPFLRLQLAVLLNEEEESLCGDRGFELKEQADFLVIF